MLGRVRRMVANLVNQRAADQALDEELRSAVEILAHEKIRQGTSASEARRQALVELGGVEQVKEAVRGARALVFVDTAIADVRVAVRALRRNPGFAAAAVATIALGIGATTAVFSIVNGVLLRPLPYREPERLVRIENGRFGAYSLAAPEFFDYRDRQRSLESFAVFAFDSGTLTGHGDAVRVRAAIASSEFFHVLGVDPIRGRTFGREEDRPGMGHVAVLRYGFWQSRFGGDPGVVGRALTIDGLSHTVIGVMPPGFGYPSDSVDLWIPIGFDRAAPGPRNSHYFRSIGRLRHDRSLAQASEDVRSIAQQLMAEFPEAYPRDFAFDKRVHLRTLHEATVGSVRPAMLVLAGAVVLVLLIACANVANLLLVRGASRQHEIALRAALGAGRWRIVRQLLTESLLLSSAGGLLGLGLAHLSLRALVALEPRSIPRLQELAIDSPTLAFAAGAVVLTGILAGLMPALHAVPKNLHPSLRETSRTTQSASRRRLSQGLVVAEVALSFLLPVGAGLLGRSFVSLLAVDIGFSTENVLTLSLATAPPRYTSPEQRLAFFDQVLTRVGALPGVQAAGAVSGLPLAGGFNNGFLMIEGKPVSDKGLNLPWGLINAGWRIASPGYFPALRIALRGGRLFRDSDVSNSPPVVIVDEQFSQEAWGGVNPVGRRVAVVAQDGSPALWRTVVGVVRHVREQGPASRNLPQAYFPLSQRQFGTLFVTIRAVGSMDGLLRLVRQEMTRLDPSMPIDDVATLDARLGQSVAAPRFNVQVMSTFGLLALALSSIGLAGVVAYAVSRRTREIGVRVALGARRGQVLRLILGQGIRLIVVGLAAGLVGARALSRLVAAMLFEVSPTDTVSYLSAAVLWFAVALLACYIPARRALEVDPVVALRTE